MRKTNEGPSPVGVLLPSAVVGLLATLLLMLVGAIFVHRLVLAEQAIAPCALIFLAVGCALAASALGGFAGANMRKRKKYRHLKK